MSSFNCSLRPLLTGLPTRPAEALLAFICLIFSAQPASGQSVGKESLAGLDGVNVAVSVSEEVKEGGLSEETIKSNTELQLRKADIDVYTDGEQRNDPASPVFFVRVAAHGGNGLLGFSISTEMAQTVQTTAGNQANGLTWLTPDIVGTIGETNVRDLIDEVRQKVRVFINDWLEVHEQ